MIDPNQLANIERTLGELTADVAAIKSAVSGNGLPGLNQRVSNLELKSATQKGALKVALWLASSVAGLKLLEWAGNLGKFVYGGH